LGPPSVESGGFNDSVVPASPYEREVLDVYETGAKTTLLDRHLSFNTSTF